MTIPAYKLEPTDPEHSAKIQEILFKRGFFWDKGRVRTPKFTDKQVLYAHHSGQLTFSSRRYAEKHHPNLETRHLWQLQKPKSATGETKYSKQGTLFG